jgi:hypothetical protein
LPEAILPAPTPCRPEIIVTLLTDRLAKADTDLPDGTNDRLGLRANMALPLAKCGTGGRSDSQKSSLPQFIRAVS